MKFCYPTKICVVFGNFEAEILVIFKLIHLKSHNCMSSMNFGEKLN